jgi:hypothetical protein
VERRQASAPAAEGRREPISPWRARTRWCGHETLRLSAFRFLRFISHEARMERSVIRERHLRFTIVPGLRSAPSGLRKAVAV